MCQAEARGTGAAFFVLSVAVREVRGCFTRGLPGFRRALAILSGLVDRHLPRLATHLFRESSSSSSSSSGGGRGSDGVGATFGGLHLQMFASPWLQCE